MTHRFHPAVTHRLQGDWAIAIRRITPMRHMGARQYVGPMNTAGHRQHSPYPSSLTVCDITRITELLDRLDPDGDCQVAGCEHNADTTPRRAPERNRGF